MGIFDYPAGGGVRDPEPHPPRFPFEKPLYPIIKIGVPNRWTIPDKDYSDFGDQALQESKEPGTGILPFNVFGTKEMTSSHGGLTSGVSGEQEQTTHDGPGAADCTTMAMELKALFDTWVQAELDFLICQRAGTGKCSYADVRRAQADYASYLEDYRAKCPRA